MPFTSFVIPTIGRVSLTRALDSVLNQTDDDWEAVVVADGTVALDDIRENAPNRHLEDERIIWGARTQGVPSAGLTRNSGIKQAEGDWVAFLDDDDHLDRYYVQLLREHATGQPQVDVVVFRMQDPTFGILPDPDNPEIELGRVGISFAVKRQLIEEHDLKFIREKVHLVNHEDIQFLKEAESAGGKFYISPYVTYYVRNEYE